MADSRCCEQATLIMIGKSAVLISECIRAFSLVLTLVALTITGCGGEETMSKPDRSTIRSLAEYVLWTFRIDSVEEFDKVNPPMELIEQRVGKDDPDLPMVKAMLMGMRQDSLDHWKAIKKLASELGIDWRKTKIVDVRFGEIFGSRSEGVDFQESSGVGVLFETNGKRWALGLDDPMRKVDGPWYFRDGFRWDEDNIRASIQSSVTCPSRKPHPTENE